MEYSKEIKELNFHFSLPDTKCDDQAAAHFCRIVFFHREVGWICRKKSKKAYFFFSRQIVDGSPWDLGSSADKLLMVLMKLILTGRGHEKGKQLEAHGGNLRA